MSMRSSRRRRSRHAGRNEPLILAEHLPPASNQELRDALLDVLISAQAMPSDDSAFHDAMAAAVTLLERGAVDGRDRRLVDPVHDRFEG